MTDVKRVGEAITRLQSLEKQRVVYISDGSSGGDKVGAALAFARIMNPALQALLTDFQHGLNMAEMMNKKLQTGPMDKLVDAILTVPTPMSHDRLTELLSKISEVD